MIVEVTPQGLWRQTAKSRDLLLGKSELASVDVFKSRVNEILHVELNARSRNVRVQGLEHMASFVDDLRQAFPGAVITEHRHTEELGTSQIE